NLIPQAQEDAASFKKRLRRDSSGEEQQAALQLEKAVADRAEIVHRFGPETPLLRRQAAQAFEEKRYAEAERKLRLAPSRCAVGGKKEGEKELASLLFRAAVEAVNEKTAKADNDPESVAAACAQAFEKMLEASRLDPENKQIRKQLDELRSLEKQIRESAELE